MINSERVLLWITGLYSSREQQARISIFTVYTFRYLVLESRIEYLVTYDKGFACHWIFSFEINRLADDILIRSKSHVVPLTFRIHQLWLNGSHGFLAVTNALKPGKMLCQSNLQGKLENTPTITLNFGHCLYSCSW